ncbi:hypothetical protein CDAR_452181 [Caerostris darwini]|uniref:Uncharacterized protein n=1 Tax=Caerostris darwini TaxID=1538125 RepID=A0AAV4PM05_9ARAC|nr:hypothetical protein CDAR_452181 [Caerostris darwini]
MPSNVSKEKRTNKKKSHPDFRIYCNPAKKSTRTTDNQIGLISTPPVNIKTIHSHLHFYFLLFSGKTESPKERGGKKPKIKAKRKKGEKQIRETPIHFLGEREKLQENVLPTNLIQAFTPLGILHGELVQKKRNPQEREREKKNNQKTKENRKEGKKTNNRNTHSLFRRKGKTTGKCAYNQLASSPYSSRDHPRRTSPVTLVAIETRNRDPRSYRGQKEMRRKRVFIYVKVWDYFAAVCGGRISGVCVCSIFLSLNM